MSSSYRNSEPRPPIMAGLPPPPEWRLPFADWDRPPWNRWAFHHIREILPTAEVWRGAGPVSKIAGAGQGVDLSALAYTAPDGSAVTVGGMLDATYTDGFLVILDGKVVHESYHNGMDPRSRHLSQSVAKSVTALAAGALVGEGLLDPARPITDYLPELALTAWAGATLQHVLDMTSGARFSEDYEDPLCDIGMLDVSSGWKPAVTGHEPACVWDQILGMTAVEAPHGTRFQYRSIETDVLAHTMQRVAGQSLPEIVSTRLWQPMGAEEDAYFTVDRTGYALACGGFNATLRDYARLGLLLVNGGGGVVPGAWVEDIYKGPHGLFNDHGRVNQPNGVYRNQFWVEDADADTVMAKGVFGQLILADRAAGLVAVKLSSWPAFLNPDLDQLTRFAIRAIQQELGA